MATSVKTSNTDKLFAMKNALMRWKLMENVMPEILEYVQELECENELEKSISRPQFRFL